MECEFSGRRHHDDIWPMKRDALNTPRHANFLDWRAPKQVNEQKKGEGRVKGRGNGGGLHAGRDGSRGARTKGNLIEWVGEQRMNERMNERIKGRGSICHRPPASGSGKGGPDDQTERKCRFSAR